MAVGPQHHSFVSGPFPDRCYLWYPNQGDGNGGFYCTRPEREHMLLKPVTLPSGPPVRSDYERALERIRELEDREKANANHFQTVWDQLTEQKLLRDANEGRIRELEERLKVPPESEAHVWKRRALDAESQLIKNIDTIEALRQEVVALKSQRDVLTDSERSLGIKLSMAESHAKNLADDLYISEEERLKAVTRAGDLELRLDESLKREGALNQRLSNLDTLARDFLARVEKMTSALDR